MDATPENNVASWIARRAEAGGDQPAVADHLRRLDYAGFEQRIRQLAGWLRALGVSPGDRVGILLGNCSAYLEALFAAARIGAIAVPINTRSSAREVCFLLDDCSPTTISAIPTRTWSGSSSATGELARRNVRAHLCRERHVLKWNLDIDDLSV